MNRRNVMFIAAALILDEIEEESRKRSVWARQFWFRGASNPYYEKLMGDLANEGDDFFKRFAHISQQCFQDLCEKVRPRVEKQTTFMRVPISVEERVALTLKYLACGDSAATLSQLFRISPPSILTIIPEVCKAIYETMHAEHLKMPSTNEEWCEIARKFEECWNYPNCIGAIDGKHVLCKAPPKSGSSYFNYKGTFSIVLLALADAKYRFIYVNIGAKGSASDGGIFNACPFSTALMDDSLNLPRNRPLPGRTSPVPYCIVADDAFAASERVMKPISGGNLSRIDRAYNYQ